MWTNLMYVKLGGMLMGTGMEQQVQQDSACPWHSGQTWSNHLTHFCCLHY